MTNTLEKLYRLIELRKKEMPQGSYTTSLFKAGENKILKKLGEEIVELVQGCVKKSKEEIIYESADILYHIMVTLVYYDVSLKEVLEELERRNNE